MMISTSSETEASDNLKEEKQKRNNILTIPSIDNVQNLS